MGRRFGSRVRWHMVRTCEQAIRIGLSAVVFTEHLDLEQDWHAVPGGLGGGTAERYLDSSGRVRIPPFDVDGYLRSIDQCRRAFPNLGVITGAEFGEPHLHESEASDLLRSGVLERINGSLHVLADGQGGRAEPASLYQSQEPDAVMQAYLEEVPHMATGSRSFQVFTHIDYAVRTWPSATAGPFDSTRFEDDFRVAMCAIADSDRALELNTRRLWSWIPQWWAEEGGRAVTFGSDAHQHLDIATNFPEAAAMAEHYGFTPGRQAEDFWTR